MFENISLLFNGSADCDILKWSLCPLQSCFIVFWPGLLLCRSPRPILTVFPFVNTVSFLGIDFLKNYFFISSVQSISHGCTCVPPSETLLPPPSPSHPSGFSQCTDFEFPVSCIKLGLVIYFTYFTILFLSNHPTLTFSQSPKFCSLYLCSFCCLAYRVIITIVLNSIYMC